MSVNKFLEKELQKIFGTDDIFSNTKYISGVCYGELDNDLKVKCQFDTSFVMGHYDLLQISIINRKEGVIDKHKINFIDVWGKIPFPNNPNFPNGVEPYIWTYNGKTEWYNPAPKERHYEILRDNVKNYLDIFRDKSIELEPKPSIKKQLSDNKNISTQKKPAKSKNNDLEV